MRLSDGEQRQMEARLAVRYAAAGAQTQAWLEEQLSALSPDCALLTRWCYSASPLSDWANYDFALFRACAEHGLFLREHSPLAKALPETLFLNYVLHPRVNEEALCDCRGFFIRSCGIAWRGFPRVKQRWRSTIGTRSRSATARPTTGRSARWMRGAPALGGAARNPHLPSMRCAQPVFRPGRSIRRAGRTATTIMRGSRCSATAHGIFSVRVSRRKRWTAAGLPALPAARCWYTAAASERPRQMKRSSPWTARSRFSIRPRTMRRCGCLRRRCGSRMGGPPPERRSHSEFSMNRRCFRRRSFGRTTPGRRGFAAAMAI